MFEIQNLFPSTWLFELIQLDLCEEIIRKIYEESAYKKLHEIFSKEEFEENIQENSARLRFFIVRWWLDFLILQIPEDKDIKLNEILLPCDLVTKFDDKTFELKDHEEKKRDKVELTTYISHILEITVPKEDTFKLYFIFVDNLKTAYQENPEQVQQIFEAIKTSWGIIIQACNQDSSFLVRRPSKMWF